MGKLRACLVVAASAAALAACGSDSGAKVDAAVIHDAPIDVKTIDAAPDAPSYDFSCMTNPAPANGSATATITIAGSAQEVSLNGITPMIAAAAGASLTACLVGAANCSGGNKYDGPVTSLTDGSFTFAPITTGTNPIDPYIAMTKTGDRDVYIYPPQQLAADLGMVPALTFTTGAYSGAKLYFSVTEPITKGSIAVAVTDCANTPIDGATITLTQGGTAVAGTTDKDLGLLSSMAAGIHLIFNVPPGDTLVGATYMGMTLHEHTIKAVADATAQTIVRPGYF